MRPVRSWFLVGSGRNQSHSSGASTFHLWLPLASSCYWPVNPVLAGFSFYLTTLHLNSTRMLYALKNCAAPLAAANFFLPRHNLRSGQTKVPEFASQTLQSETWQSNQPANALLFVFDFAVIFTEPCNLFRCDYQKNGQLPPFLFVTVWCWRAGQKSACRIHTNCLHYLKVVWTVLFLRMASFFSSCPWAHVDKRANEWTGNNLRWSQAAK